MVLRGQTLAHSTYYIAAALNVMTFASNQANAQCVVERWTTASRSRPVFACPKDAHQYRHRRGYAGRRPTTPLLLSERFTQTIAFFKQAEMHASSPRRGLGGERRVAIVGA